MLEISQQSQLLEECKLTLHTAKPQSHKSEQLCHEEVQRLNWLSETDQHIHKPPGFRWQRLKLASCDSLLLALYDQLTEDNINIPFVYEGCEVI